MAHRIGAVPQVAAAYRAGSLSFDQLADFVRLTRSCHGPRRAQDGQRLVRQQDLDGGGFIYAELGPVGFATVNAAIDAGADALDAHADREGVPCETSRQRLRAEGLVLLAEVFLAGCDGHDRSGTEAGRDAAGDALGDVVALGGRSGMPRPARPTVQVLVDVAHATVDRFGALLRTVGGDRVPMLSARLLDMLGANAELIVQLRDGRQPLAELRAKDTPEPGRRAVLARDGGVPVRPVQRPALGAARAPHRRPVAGRVP